MIVLERIELHRVLQLRMRGIATDASGDDREVATDARHSSAVLRGRTQGKQALCRLAEAVLGGYRVVQPLRSAARRPRPEEGAQRSW